jgi:hypothetical protein
MPPRSRPQPLQGSNLSTLPLDRPAQFIIVAVLHQVIEHLQRRSRPGVKRGLSEYKVALAQAVLSQEPLVHRPESSQREGGHGRSSGRCQLQRAALRLLAENLDQCRACRVGRGVLPLGGRINARVILRMNAQRPDDPVCAIKLKQNLHRRLDVRHQIDTPTATTAASVGPTADSTSSQHMEATAC